MRLARRLELGHLPAVELEVLGFRERLADVAGEGDRHEPVLPAPHEQAGDSPTIRPTRAELRKPISNATRPPIELPIRCARSIPHASMKPQTARAKKAGS